MCVKFIPTEDVTCHERCVARQGGQDLISPNRVWRNFDGSIGWTVGCLLIGSILTDPFPPDVALSRARNHRRRVQHLSERARQGESPEQFYVFSE